MNKAGGPSRSPRARWVLAIASAALAAIWLLMMLGGTGPLDQRVYEALYAGHRPALALFATVATQLGAWQLLVPLTLAIGGWLCWRGHPHSALTLIMVTMVGRGVNSLLKLEVHRARPALEQHLVIEHSNSFPSGHSAASMIFYLTVALLLAHRGRWRRWAVAAAVAVSLLVGMSRVMLGVHWPSDVIGGWAFGTLWVILSLRMAEDLIERQRPRR